MLKVVPAKRRCALAGNNIEDNQVRQQGFDVGRSDSGTIRKLVVLTKGKPIINKLTTGRCELKICNHSTQQNAVNLFQENAPRPAL
jgi:hypothetical protein